MKKHVLYSLVVSLLFTFGFSPVVSLVSAAEEEEVYQHDDQGGEVEFISPAEAGEEEFLEDRADEEELLQDDTLPGEEREFEEDQPSYPEDKPDYERG